MKSHKDLEVWNLAMDLVVSIYRLTDTFPKSELFGLTDQIKRSAVTIPSNISEGAARQTSKEFIQFLHIARGSCAELETQLLLSKRLFFTNIIDSVLEQIEVIGKMLNGLIRQQKSLLTNTNH